MLQAKHVCVASLFWTTWVSRSDQILVIVVVVVVVVVAVIVVVVEALLTTTTATNFETWGLNQYNYAILPVKEIPFWR